MTPTARSLQHLKSLGYAAKIVEKWNPFAKIRQDFGDVLPLNLLSESPRRQQSEANGKEEEAGGFRDRGNTVGELLTDCQIYGPRDWTSEVADVVGGRNEVPPSKKRRVTRDDRIRIVKIEITKRKIVVATDISTDEISPGDLCEDGAYRETADRPDHWLTGQ